MRAAPVSRFSPRAAREADGTIVLFATFENNWYLQGPDWNHLSPACLSAGHGAENSDPDALDDKYWIQALYSVDGIDFIALGSHEYLGGRHSGNCRIRSSGTMAPPCWYSSITQYELKGDARHFHRARQAPVLARPQIGFDPTRVKRIGYFTASNIVSQGDYRYVLIFAEGSELQARGNCLFRAPLRADPTAWRAWDGVGFKVNLSSAPSGDSAATKPACRPLQGLPHEVRGLVRHSATGLWIAIYTGRIGKRTGVEYATSPDLFNWSPGRLLLEAALTRRDPDCPNVYRYPSLIDQTASGFTFETTGDMAFLYSVKIVLQACRPVAREIVRIPIQIKRDSR